MITNEEIEDVSYRLAHQFEKINYKYVSKMAKHIKSIGRLTPDDIDRVAQLQKMYANMDEVSSIIQKQAKITAKELNKFYDDTAKTMYKEAKSSFDFNNVKYVSFKNNLGVQNYLTAMKNQTANTFYNLSKTTYQSANYINAVDNAIQAVTSGMGGVQEQISKVILQQSKQRLSVQYPSGRKLRLDSAVNMNVRDGIRQLKNEEMRIIGQQFGADAIEIDAHGLCAPDHLPFQGRQFKIEKFFDSTGRQIMDTGRPIGTMNCQHGITYVISKFTKPVYSKEQLKQMEEYSNQKIDVIGKEMTRYEADQLMRGIEMKMRDYNTQLNAVFDEKIKSKLDEAEMMYNEVARDARLKPRMNRTQV